MMMNGGDDNTSDGSEREKETKNGKKEKLNGTTFFIVFQLYSFKMSVEEDTCNHSFKNSSGVQRFIQPSRRLLVW